MRKILYIENFGPVKKAEVILKEINIFIGEQSIGKSTIAKLITILTDHLSLISILYKKQDAWESFLEQYAIKDFAKQDYKVEYIWDFDDVNLTLNISRGSLSYVMKEQDKEITDIKHIANVLISKKCIYHDEELNKLIDRAEKTQKDEDKFSVVNFLTNSLYIPAERVIYSIVNNLWPAMFLVKASIPSNILKFITELQNAKVAYPDFDVPLLNIKYKYENSEDFYILNENQERYPISVASSGIQSTLPLLLVLHYAVNKREFSSFVIEEPECNLFPDKQVELLNYIIKTVKSKERILTITTHSPYTLSLINNYLYAGYLQKEYRERINNKLPQKLLLNLSEDTCSVYSLGERINEDGIYCKSIVDEETGLIDFNSLDYASIKMSEEFGELENVHLNILNGII